MQIYFNINHADDLHIPERFENCLNPSGDTKYAAFKYMYRHVPDNVHFQRDYN
jgi:hypothetical protein